MNTTTITPPRPAITPELIAQAARTVCAYACWSPEKADLIADVYEPNMDGYQLAKRMESQHGWNITVSDVDDLDGMSDEVRSLHREACLAWAREHDIQPPLPIGTMTTRGEITGVSEHEPATYLIREPGAPENRRLLVRFEDARAA